MAWQFHGAEVVRADGRGIVTPGVEFERCDGLWTDAAGPGAHAPDRGLPPGRPGARERRPGGRGAPRRLAGPAGRDRRVGSRGTRGRALRRRDRARDRAVLLRGGGRGRRRLSASASGTRSSRGGTSTCTRRRSAPCARPGAESVERVGLCTSCEEELFFSHRRDRGRTGRQGILPLSAEAVRAQLRAHPWRGRRRRHRRRRDEVRVRGRAAASSPRPGVEVVGENRLQDLAAKHARYGDAFRVALHRPPPVAQGARRLRALRRSATRSRARLGRAAGSTIPALVEVNLSGEESKSGVAPEALAAVPRRGARAAASTCAAS